ncbi:uncharacterized protein LOC135499168 [Lineus longissimus]|uniref:uncharacterized protein LOC135499168 n=1 Tax=Lineus longissimus TaxID=88925 RepID=UPI00315C596E
MVLLKFESVVNFCFQRTAEDVRRERLQEVRLANIRENKGKIKDLEKQLDKDESNKSGIEKELQEEEDHFATLQARKDDKSTEQTSVDDELEKNRNNRDKLSKKLEALSLTTKKLRGAKNELSEDLDKGEKDAKKLERELYMYLKALVTGQQYEDSLNEWREMNENVRAFRPTTDFKIFNAKKLTDLWDVLKSLGYMSLGDYTALVFFLAFTPNFKQLTDKIHSTEDSILGPYDKTKERKFSDFQRKEDGLLGRGSYGAVWSYQDMKTGETIAIKEIDAPGSLRTKEGEALLNEVKIMCEISQYKHQHIVQYYFEHNDEATGKWYIGMEYLTGGSLTKKIAGQPLTEDKLRSYTYQILCGIQFLHGKHIAHRDIKSDNILLSFDDRIKLADFGISKKLEASRLTHGALTVDKGTVQYMSPEAVKGEDDEKKGYGLQTDIWSVGCVVLEMAKGTRPWSESGNAAHVLFMIGSKNTPSVAENVPDSVKDFLKKTFIVIPKDRPSAKDLLKDKLRKLHSHVETYSVVSHGRSNKHFPNDIL